jgi:predicted Zn finger-like uncharacterized protein
MKITCPACNANYRLPDDRIQGKNRIFRINCKRCGAEIRVRGVETEEDSGRTTLPFALDLPAPASTAAAAAPAQVWFAGIEGKQVGPLTEAEVTDHIQAHRLNADDLVWRKGFAAWTAVKEVPPFDEIVAEVAAAAAGAPKTEKRSPRRAQTLELSAAMIELLVKLDGQSDAAADAPPLVVEPPQLPAAETAARVEVAAAKPAAKPATQTVAIAGDRAAAEAAEQVVQTLVAPAPRADDAQPRKVVPPAVEPAPAKAAQADDGAAARGQTRGSGSRDARPAPEPKRDARPATETRPVADARPAVDSKRGAVATPGRQAPLAPDSGVTVATVAPRAPAGAQAAAARPTQTERKSPAMLIGGGVAALAIIGGVIFAVVRTPAPGTPAPQTNEVASAAAGASEIPAGDQQAQAAAQAAASVPGTAPTAAGSEVAVAPVDPAAAPGAPAAAPPAAAPAPAAPAVAAAAPTPALPAPAAASAPAGQQAQATPPPPPPPVGAKGVVPAAAPVKPVEAAAPVANPKTAPVVAPPSDDEIDRLLARNKEKAAKAEKEEAARQAKAAKAEAAQKAEAAKAEKARKEKESSAAKASAKADAARKAKEAEAAKKAAKEEAARKAKEAEAAKKAAKEDAARKAKEDAAAKKASAASGGDDEIDRILAAQKNKEKDKTKKTAPADTEDEPTANTGGLDQAQVNGIAARANQKVMRCYMLHGDVDSGEDTIKVTLYVNGDGSVGVAKVIGKHANTAVGTCVVAAVKALTFPQSSGTSKKYTVRYTVGI